MENFDHPAAHRSHQWDLAEAGRHEHKIELIDNPERQDLLAWAFRTWFENAKPKLSALPQQFIHGDAHDENILVCGRLAVTVIMAAERRQIDPSHPARFISEQGAWDLLAFLRTMGAGQDIRNLL